MLNFIISWNTEAWNKKCVLPNDLGSKHSLIMKFGQFMSCYKRRVYIEKCKKYVARKLVWGFLVFKLPLGNQIFETRWLYWIYISKTIKICQNQHIDFLRFFVTENSLEIKKGLKLVFRQYFYRSCWWKLFIKLVKFQYHIAFFSPCSLKYFFGFMLRHLMMPWNLRF